MVYRDQTSGREVDAVLTSRTTHTLQCDLCTRKTTATGGTPEQLREKAAACGWETRPAPEAGSPDLDLCPQCVKENPRQTVRQVEIGKGRRHRPRLFGRNYGIFPPAGPASPGPPSGPKTT